MEDFKVGDEVICDKSYPNLPQKGWKGKVVRTLKGKLSNIIWIEWEQSFFWGTNGGGKGKDGHCRNYFKYLPIDLKHIKDDSVDILSLNKTIQLELF
jgi:hypothetical protein